MATADEGDGSVGQPDERPDDGDPYGGTTAARLVESGRVEAFSDGVLAIVITLLVLDLHAPEARGEVLNDLVDQWPAYVAYLASFAYVGVIWVNHHQLFTRIAVVDTRMLWLNLLLLLTTSVLPFPTAVLSSAFQHGSHGDQVAAMALYAGVSAAMSGTWFLLFQYLSANERLLAEGTPPSFFVQERRRALLGIGLYLIVVVIGLWQPIAGLVVACGLPVFYGLTTEGWSPRRPGRSEAPPRTRSRRG
jgi:uncharacterized membrane protein